MRDLQAIAKLGLITFLLILLPSNVKADPPPVSSSVTVSATIPFPTGSLRMTGYASPGALVTFLKSGVVAGTTSANSGSFFDKTLSGLDPGVQSFSIYASDSSGRSTLTISFDANIVSGSTVALSGFLLPPTIAITNNTHKRPSVQKASGMGKNNSTVTAFFNSETVTKQVATDNNGNWEAKVSEIFNLGSHSSNSLIQDSGGSQSVLSQTLPFTVVLSADLNVDTSGTGNGDSLVNLTDFSIMMFNYARSNFPNKAADINDNGVVDLQDFSIMMFHWTGG